MTNQKGVNTINNEVLSVQAQLEPKKEEKQTETRRHGARTRPSPRPTAGQS